MLTPFDQCTPVQKAMLYRSLLCLQNQLKREEIALVTYPPEFDEHVFIAEITGFQLKELAQLLLLLEQSTEPDELRILPLVNEYMKQNNSTFL